MNEIIERFKTNTVPFGSAYILPDGTILDLSEFENGHADFFALTGYSAAELKEKRWLRLNTRQKYIELPPEPTKWQLAVLNRVYAVFGDDFQAR